METVNRSQRIFISLFLFITVSFCVYFLVGFGAMAGWWHDGSVTNSVEWPEALRLAIAEHPEAIDDIRVYQMFAYFDHHSIWWIDGHPTLVDGFIKQHDLESTSRSHPVADRLLDSIRAGWQKPNLFNSEWYATPEFGSRHIEGPDLFLLVIDREQHVTIVLHDNIF